MKEDTMTTSIFNKPRKADILAVLLFCYATLLSLSVSAKTPTKDYEQLLSVLTSPDGQKMDYGEFIQRVKIPSISFAVVDNYEVVYSHASGYKDMQNKDNVDKHTAYSTASISKPVTATIVAMLAEQGKLSLDAPVSQYLKRWQMPTSPFTENHPITVRELLTHTAGTSQSGFADFFLGDDIPTLVESLNGVKLPRYNTPISIEFAPGTNWNYSGGGYVIVQVAIEDLTGKTLQQLAEEMLFTPLGMNNTTMYQNGHTKFLKNIAKAHNSDLTLNGDGILVCPQIAPSGMWSTPEDMAKFVIEYQKALSGEKTKVISSWVANETTRVHTIENVDGWAAGWMRLEARANIDWFSHGGSNTGMGGHIMGSMTGGKGIMLFSNASTPQRVPAIEGVIENIISALGWEETITPINQKPQTSLTTDISGRYLSNFDQIVTIEKDGNKLIYKNPLRVWGTSFKGELYYQGKSLFALDSHANLLSIETNPDDNKQYITFSREGTELKTYAMRKLEAGEVMPFEVAESGTIDESITAYKAWQKKKPNSRLLRPSVLNEQGYGAVMRKKFDAAVNYIAVYVALYPQDANAYDSLGEVYMLKGNKELAIQNYKKSLELNASNDNAKQMLAKLEG
jgi:CubicO group peptidase (beta-lactamase class C family)